MDGGGGKSGDGSPAEGESEEDDLLAGLTWKLAQSMFLHKVNELDTLPALEQLGKKQVGTEKQEVVSMASLVQLLWLYSIACFHVLLVMQRFMSCSPQSTLGAWAAHNHDQRASWKVSPPLIPRSSFGEALDLLSYQPGLAHAERLKRADETYNWLSTSTHLRQAPNACNGYTQVHPYPAHESNNLEVILVFLFFLPNGFLHDCSNNRFFVFLNSGGDGHG